MDKQAFAQFLTVRKGLQEITVSGYVEASGRITRVIGVAPDHATVESFVYELYRSEYSYSHKINTVLALEKYMEFIGNPIRLGRQKKPKRIVKDTLTESEVTKLIFSCKNIREKAIMTLLAYSGIRNKELCDLRVKNIDLHKNTVRVIQGKGLKDGISNISPECSRIISQYLNEHPRSSEDFLFTTLRRNNQYRGQDLRKFVHVVSRRAQIEKRVYPHLLRHSLTSNMLLRGAHIITLNRQLRHTLLETTLHYVNSIVFGERNEYDKFIPSYI